MKKQIAIGAALFLLLVIGVSAFGQTQGVKVNVPFNFTLADKMFPAGEYAFTTMSDNTLQMQRDGKLSVALFLADRVSGRINTAQVRFNCYDSVCFLRQIWIPGVDNGFQARRSQGEDEVAAKRPGRYLALLDAWGRSDLELHAEGRPAAKSLQGS